MAAKKKTSKQPAKAGRRAASSKPTAKAKAGAKAQAKNSKKSKTSGKAARAASAKAAVKAKAKKSSTAKKAAAQKKSPAKKSTAKKAAAQKKSPAKKSTAKKAAVQKAQAAKLAQKAKLEALRQRERQQAAREKAQAAKAKAAERAQKEKEREKAEREKARARAEREREAARALKEKEREKERLQKEKERVQKEKEREKERIQKEKERLRIQKEKEKERLQKEKERLRIQKEKEKERILREKEREKERIRKEKEREAYRRAREAERERLRAERDAARRALEGRIAAQAKEHARISGGSRGGSSRVYRPDAIPSQAGTRREGDTPVRAVRPVPVVTPPARPAPPLPPRQPVALDPETRWAAIEKRLARMPEKFRREYSESFDMSWIHHDSALEGVVYTYPELKTAIDSNIVIVPDSSLQPVCEEIRRHKRALEWTRELGASDAQLTAETLKRLYLILHPEEGDLKSVKYRKEIPQHRLYFHEYAPPDKIAVRIRQAFEWLHGPEPGKLKDAVRVAARLHYDLLRTFPFPEDSGKVARLLMNVLLLRAKLPPVIVHSTERQRYYDALRGSLPTIVLMVNDSMKNALTSIEKVLDEEELALTTAAESA